MPENPLIAQLQEQKFLRAIDYVVASADGLKNLNTSEMAQLNQLLTGLSDDPWRRSSASVTIPSGKTHQFSVHSNPIHQAREIIESANQIAGGGDLQEAAYQIYYRFVLAHLFNDANRRTAALAGLWLLRSHGKDIDAVALVEGGLGDLREDAALQALKKRISSMIR